MGTIVRECKDCHQDFEISEGEQRFFDSQGWDPPIRCKECRRKKKLAREQGDREWTSPAPARKPQQHRQHRRHPSEPNFAVRDALNAAGIETPLHSGNKKRRKPWQGEERRHVRY